MLVEDGCSLLSCLPRSRQTCDPPKGLCPSHTLSPHLLVASLRPQEAKGTSHCSKMAAAPPSSTSPARVPCAPSPAPCSAVIHGSSPALPYMGTLHFLIFPALGKPKGAFLYALPPALFAPLVPCPGASHRPTMPHDAPHATPAPLCSHPMPSPHHLNHHRCHPHPKAHASSPCSNPWLFSCPQMMVQQSRLARQGIPADHSVEKGLWCSSLSQHGHSPLSAEKLARMCSL